MEKRKLLIFITSIFLLLGLSYGIAKGSKNTSKYLSLSEVKEKWGQQPFSKELWLKTLPSKRYLMVSDLIEKKHFVGKTFKEVIADLGQYDGYYENDGIPAYIVTPTGKKETWQIIFLPSKDWKKVEEVKMHKNCCS